MPEPIVIATWPFGQTAVSTAIALLRQGKPALDAALAGAQAVEDDPKVHSVGFAGLANRVGTVQLDACVMDGKTLACGAVAGLENVRHPAALARRVMEKTPHVLLVGEGARWFALQEGFPLEHLSTPESLAEWEKRRPRAAPPPGGEGSANRQGTLPSEDGLHATAHAAGSPAEADADNHDTVTVLALDAKGQLGGVCTTSGLAHKMPGRVGDSPIIGAGLYVDDTAGAAGGTGVGEEIIRVGGSLLIVEAMRTGRTPQEACDLAVRRVNQAAVRRGVHPARVAFLALDPKGRHGAACTAQTGFEFAVARGEKKVELLKAKEIAAQDK
jgi:isoaspartyl peptidase/L-asparaginase-like protein (Ntn-hydrolase superfamily)